MAVAIAEGFCEGEGASKEQQIAAWQHIIDNGLCQTLQGWFGRTAKTLIDAGVCQPAPVSEHDPEICGCEYLGNDMWTCGHIDNEKQGTLGRVGRIKPLRTKAVRSLLSDNKNKMVKLKFCTKCNENYPATIEFFYSNKPAKDGLSFWCKECGKRDSRKRKQQHRESEYQRKYGITIKQYNKMFNLQHGCCAVCNKHQSTFEKRLAVDHNHKTGKIRGLLCAGCNANVGFYEKRQKMITAYLKKYKEF